MPEFHLVAMGGTFDILHKGHIALLSKAFSISSSVIIGLTGDELAKRRGKQPVNSFEKRLQSLESLIKKNFPGTAYQISKLDNDFGPAVLEQGVEALVVSDETEKQGSVLNDLRAQRNLPPVRIVTVPMVLAEDGTRISTTRIKNSEIDSNGNLS
ncbi:MAG: phosphopantetheine adenylyltransferase [Nitrosarchaeum sp.]|nr:phosphopantetheine adenylyltransferase [Nitrosarchaeum sp.]MCA9820473.1 phosphopantetheine adenylyltransferase [Nitrosarchaeum sp.]